MCDTVEHFLRISDHVHLVHGRDDVPDAEQAGDVGMAPRLREHALGGIDQDHSGIRRGRPGCHIAGVLLMSGSVGDDEFPPQCGKVAVGDINRNALLAFGAQAVGQQREIQRAGRSIDSAVADSSKLVLVHTLAVVQ